MLKGVPVLAQESGASLARAAKEEVTKSGRNDGSTLSHLHYPSWGIRDVKGWTTILGVQ